MSGAITLLPQCAFMVWIGRTFKFLGALVKLRKATASSYLSVLMEHLDSHWTDWRVIGYFIGKIRVSIQSDTKNGHFTWRPLYVWIIFRSILLKKRNLLTKVVQKIKTHFTFSKFLSVNSAVYEIMWKKCGRDGQAIDDNIIRRMPFARWITMVTNTHSEYVILIAFPLQEWLYNSPYC